MRIEPGGGISVDAHPYNLTFATHSLRPVPNRFLRLLMLWLVIALQAMTPFVHAHAGSAQASHASWLHGHAGVPGDVAYHLAENREQGTEIEVAQGIRSLRQAVLFVADADASYPAPALPPSAARAARPGPAWLDVAPLQAVLPDHALPHALAPPRR